MHSRVLWLFQMPKFGFLLTAFIATMVGLRLSIELGTIVGVAFMVFDLCILSIAIRIKNFRLLMLYRLVFLILLAALYVNWLSPAFLGFKPAEYEVQIYRVAK